MASIEDEKFVGNFDGREMSKLFGYGKLSVADDVLRFNYENSDFGKVLVMYDNDKKIFCGKWNTDRNAYEWFAWDKSEKNYDWNNPHKDVELPRQKKKKIQNLGDSWKVPVGKEE